MLLMMESVFGLKERNSTILVLLLSHCPQVLIKVLKALMDLGFILEGVEH